MKSVSKSFSFVIFLGLLAGLSVQAQTKLPDLFLIDASTLVAAHKAYLAGGGEFKEAIDGLLRDAARALKAQPGSVMQKPEAPPSGDKHDYMSVAPYWWPDTTKPPGAPYIRRDGEVNPEHNIIGDRVRLGWMMGNIRTLALAYFITGNEDFGEGAVTRLRVWFLDTATRMNPNLKYAQSIKGIVEGRRIGIIDSYGFRDLIDAIQLLKQSKTWTEAMERGMRDWFTAYLQWLLESPNLVLSSIGQPVKRCLARGFRLRGITCCFHSAEKTRRENRQPSQHSNSCIESLPSLSR